MQSVRTYRQARMRNHFSYDLWKYLLIVAVCWMGWELVYTQTTYRSPQDKRIDVYIMSATASDELVEAFLKPLWEETVPEMELVEGVSMIPGSADDFYTGQVLMTRLAAGDGDIFFLPQDIFKQYALNGAFLALDDYVESGAIRLDDLDVKSARLTIIDDDTGIASTRLYGIPTDTLYGYMDGMQFDNRNAVMAIAVNNQNEANVIPFFNALIQAGRADKPEWLKEAEQQ